MVGGPRRRGDGRGLAARALRAARGVALAAAVLPAGVAAQHDHPADHGQEPAAAGEWRMPPMPPGMFMMSGLSGSLPGVAPYLPGAGIDPATLPAAAYRRVVDAVDGDTLELVASLVRRTVKGRTFVAYAFNEQYPGPLLRVPQNATLYIRFRNAIDWPSTIHWHGVRIENRFDGVPELTQPLVMPGETFLYEVRFPDAGIYWYHPHHREEITQAMGLYGNMLVSSPDPDYYGPAHRDEALILDDLLMDDAGVFPFGREAPTHALMGRFGNVFLVNGEPDRVMDVAPGEVLRLHLTNASSTRTYNLSLDPGGPLKLVASDLSRFVREQWTPSVVIAPAERYVVETRFPEAGTVALVNRIQSLDHVHGRFVDRVDTLMTFRVGGERASPDHGAAFRTLRSNAAVEEEIERYRPLFDGPPDRALRLTVEPGRLPVPILNFMEIDTVYVPPVEWNDGMPMMNWLSTGRTVRWILRDEATGRENMDIEWVFTEGDVFKLRITNDPRSFHPMQHPIHLHGQRFLVLAQDGVARTNHVWKDTAIVPTGSTVDLLVELSNPGEWMLHCHIAEHLGSGMMMVLEVEPRT